MTSISERKVPFFTPVYSSEHPLIEVVDSYFWFGGRIAEVDLSVVEAGSFGANPREESTNFVATILKISSMILSCGILPLLALIIKVHIREFYHFHWIQPRPGNPNHPGAPVANPLPGQPFGAAFPPHLADLQAAHPAAPYAEVDPAELQRAITASLADPNPAAQRAIDPEQLLCEAPAVFAHWMGLRATVHASLSRLENPRALEDAEDVKRAYNQIPKQLILTFYRKEERELPQNLSQLSGFELVMGLEELEEEMREQAQRIAAASFAVERLAQDEEYKELVAFERAENSAQVIQLPEETPANGELDSATSSSAGEGRVIPLPPPIKNRRALLAEAAERRLNKS